MNHLKEFNNLKHHPLGHSEGIIIKMTNRSKVPKWMKKGEGKVPKGKGTDMPMNFRKAEARKPRPAQNKGRGVQGGYWGHI